MFFREVGDGAQHVFIIILRENTSGDIIGSISFDDDGFVRVEMQKHFFGGKSLSESIESLLTLISQLNSTSFLVRFVSGLAILLKP